MNEFLKIFKESLNNRWEELAVLLPEILLAVIVFTAILLFAFLFRRILRRAMEKRMEDLLLGRFLSNLGFWIVLLIGLSVGLKIVGLGGFANGILAGASVSAFIIGFAFKDIGENFLAGILMAFSRPFRVGDTVEINGVKGNVQSLDLRNTHLKTFDGKDVYVPNGSVIKNNLFNHTIDGFMRHEFTLGIDQDDDYNLAIKIIMKELGGVEGILSDRRKPTVMLTGTDSNSVLVTAYYWLDTFDKKKVVAHIKSQALGNSIKALVREGFYLPNTIMELKNYKESNVQIQQAG